MTCLQLLLNPGGSFQQTNTLLYREVTHCAIQGAVGEQTGEGLLALGAAAIVAQISPLENAFGCIPRTTCETMEAFPGAHPEPTDAAKQLGPAAKCCISCYMQHFASTLSSSRGLCCASDTHRSRHAHNPSHRLCFLAESAPSRWHTSCHPGHSCFLRRDWDVKHLLC